MKKITFATAIASALLVTNAMAENLTASIKLGTSNSIAAELNYAIPVNGDSSHNFYGTIKDNDFNLSGEVSSARKIEAGYAYNVMPFFSGSQLDSVGFSIGASTYNLNLTGGNAKFDTTASSINVGTFIANSKSKFSFSSVIKWTPKELIFSGRDSNSDHILEEEVGVGYAFAKKQSISISWMKGNIGINGRSSVKYDSGNFRIGYSSRF